MRFTLLAISLYNRNNHHPVSRHPQPILSQLSRARLSPRVRFLIAVEISLHHVAAEIVVQMVTATKTATSSRDAAVQYKLPT
ncbi:uncharacterized protein L3040_004217 [Drepanopeziza brunnea f. sp. 'multigermtubi']|uniref:uncharacterized protein n=1 Tax=Drepanopeziza brunnea f. sp. 'multigermtubi' TaxID=698441 RepID=UPI002387DB03|nr:hypothetical protein L3040_004217 [Drepanopeziza brunnea f. sp. 'multigermtubi']